jgi:signal recognition particle GTPase
MANNDVALVGRMMEMIAVPMEMVVTDADKRAACDLIGTDTYGKPHWTVATISECNRVVQAFARHRIAAVRRIAAVTEALSSQDKIREVRAEAFEEAAKVANRVASDCAKSGRRPNFAGVALGIATQIRLLASQKESGQ